MSVEGKKRTERGGWGNRMDIKEDIQNELGNPGRVQRGKGIRSGLVKSGVTRKREEMDN